MRRVQSLLQRGIALALLSAYISLSVKRFDVLLGHLNWIHQPRLGYVCFTGAWYANRWSGRRFHKSAPKCLVHPLFDLLAVAAQPFSFKLLGPHHFSLPILFTDVSFTDDRFRVGIYCTRLMGGCNFAPLGCLPSNRLDCVEYTMPSCWLGKWVGHPSR